MAHQDVTPDKPSHTPGTNKGEEWQRKSPKRQVARARQQRRAARRASTPKLRDQSIRECQACRRPEREYMEPLTEDGSASDINRQEANSTGALSTLRRFARSRRDVERCELCGSEIGENHAHLLDRSSRQIACSCGACAILFCGQRRNAKFLPAIPQRRSERA